MCAIGLEPQEPYSTIALDEAIAGGVWQMGPFTPFVLSQSLYVESQFPERLRARNPVGPESATRRYPQ